MNIVSPRRTYRQSARALAAEATAQRIIEAFDRQLRERWFDEIRLEDVAQGAGVTIQTVIRRFGGKEGLLDAMHDQLGTEIRQRREVEAGDATAAISAIVEDYEQIGDLIIRTLAQEDRYPAVRKMTDAGRDMHRQWIAGAFNPWLEALDEEARRRATDALVVAGDIYVWKLVRRDMGRPVVEYRGLVESLCAAALGVPVSRLLEKEDEGAQRNDRS